jgi:hypothetical protein
MHALLLLMQDKQASSAIDVTSSAVVAPATTVPAAAAPAAAVRPFDASRCRSPADAGLPVTPEMAALLWTSAQTPSRLN